MNTKHAQHSLNNGRKPNAHICFAAGHSGGHILPCLTIANRDYRDHEIVFFTSTKPLDCALIASNSHPITHIPLAIAQSRAWYTLPFLALSLIWATCKSFWQLLTHRPERIITTGSIVALPVCIAGWLLRIPIELFELNARAGKTMLFLSWFASTVRHCFADTRMQFPRNECQLTAYPIRFTEPIEKKEIAQFTPDRITLFVQGGSQGSQEINECMAQFIAASPELHEKIQIIHQAGKHIKAVIQKYDGAHIPAHVFSFEQNITPYYAMADVIFCRSGAGSLFEALYFAKPIVTLPLITKHNTHQLFNAHAMRKEHPELCTVALNTSATQLLQKVITRKLLSRQKAIKLNV